MATDPERADDAAETTDQAAWRDDTAYGTGTPLPFDTPAEQPVPGAFGQELPGWPVASPDAEAARAPYEQPSLSDGFWGIPEPAPRRRDLATLALTWLITAVLGAGVGAAGVHLALDDPVVGRGGVVRVAPPIEDPPDEPANAAAAVAEVVLPSIVRVDVGSALAEGVGSGVIYRDDGYIVTNHHVVEDADQIEVRLATGESLPASVVGSAAPAVDIAVLKVAREALPAATFGSTAQLRVGELAVAIGSPFGLDATVTSGVISALHRNSSQTAIPIIDAIQTDAAINPGNSGGALANINGEVIGINTAILTGGLAAGNVGVGFAIPVDTVRKVADQIIATGSARLAFLGIQGQSIPGGAGALIVSVEEGGPADRAGLRAEDVILEMDGVPISSMDALISVLIAKDVGDAVEIVYEREGARRTTRATLAARPEG